MKWYQVSTEGSQPSVRFQHATTVLHRSDSDCGAVVVVYGGKSMITARGSSTTSIITQQNNHGYTDLSFFNIGSGVHEEYAKPQNQSSIHKLNKILGANGNGGGNNNSSNGSTGNSAGKPPTLNTTSLTTTTTTTSPLSAPTTPRKTYSKLPIYQGNNIYHLDNCQHSEGELPGDRVSHSIVAINSGTFKGKILLFGGFDLNSTGLSDGATNSTSTTHTLANRDISLSNDIFLLDHESLFWMKIKPTGTAPHSRHSPYLAQISNETILLFGGQSTDHPSQILTDIHLLTLSSSNILKWNQTNIVSSSINIDFLKNKLNQQSQTVYKVCYCSGYLWLIIGNPVFEIYRCEISGTGVKWSMVTFNGSIPRSLDEFTACTSFNQFIVFLIGNELNFFDTVTLEWSGLDVEGELPNKRKHHSISVIGSHLIIVGGQCELPLSTIYIKDIETIDLKQFFLKFQNKK